MRARCGRMNSPLVLNTRSTGAEVAGEQKTFSKSACKSLNAGFRLTTTMVLDILHDTTLAYSVLENFRGLELLRTRTTPIAMSYDAHMEFFHMSFPYGVHICNICVTNMESIRYSHMRYICWNPYGMHMDIVHVDFYSGFHMASICATAGPFI